MRTAGVLYLVTHVTSVAALVLYGPVLHDAAAGSDTAILVAGLLEVILALAVVGTAVALYPAVHRYSPAGAVGYTALRTLEAATILAGVVAVLAVVTLRQQHLDAGATALLAVHNWTFLIGPGLVVGVHTVLLAVVLQRFRLVPRFIPVLGLVGGPLVVASNLGVMFGAYAQESAFTAVGAVPVFAWEISLAVYLMAKGIPTPSAWAASSSAAGSGTCSRPDTSPDSPGAPAPLPRTVRPRSLR
jgi:hypothetical protein